LGVDQRFGYLGNQCNANRGGSKRAKPIEAVKPASNHVYCKTGSCHRTILIRFKGWSSLAVASSIHFQARIRAEYMDICCLFLFSSTSERYLLI
jgi:hypothetical protein